LFGVPLHVSLFGWEGVLPVVVIAATFGILLRILRLTDARGAYVMSAIGIMSIVILQGLNPAKSIFAVIGGTSGSTDEMADVSTPLALFLLLWLVMAVFIAMGNEGLSPTKKAGPAGVSIRVAMLGLPAIPFLLLLIGRASSDAVVWLLWLLAAMASVGLVAMIPWLDRLMLEANCRPRAA